MLSEASLCVSGYGLVTCLGGTHAATLAALKSGRRVAGEPLSLLAGTEYSRYRVAGLPEIAFDAYIQDRRMRKFMAPQTEIAAVAARQALEMARLDTPRFAPERIGLFAGIGLAAVQLESSVDLLRASLDAKGLFSARAFAAQGLRTINPLWSFWVLANMPACIISVLENIRGPNLIFTPWEDQTGAAVQQAAHALERGEIDCAVVLAADTPSHPANLVELAASGRIDVSETVAPAAACLVLEHAQTAARDGLPAIEVSHINLGPSPACEKPDAPLLGASGHLLVSGYSIHDPLASYIGRTIAAAPLALMALAPFIPLPRCVQGCGGQTFSFECAVCSA